MFTILGLLIFALSVLIAQRFPLSYWVNHDRKGFHADDWRDWVILFGVWGITLSAILITYTFVTLIWTSLP
jgi:predicted exporter